MFTAAASSGWPPLRPTLLRNEDGPPLRAGIYDFGPADPVDGIKFRMEQEGLTPRDPEPYIGQSGRVSEVLNRKRPLSLRMVKRLHDGLKIPYESLMAGVQ